MKKFAFIGLAFVATVTLAKPIIHFTTIETLTGAVITGKERVATKDGAQYQIWTEAEVFKNTDSWFALKFNSADIYGKMREGATCDLKVNGFRFGMFSMFRNILEADCV